MTDPSRTANDSARREEHFQRRAALARAGKHLPTLSELMRGAPFFEDDIGRDAMTFAERVVSRIQSTGPAAYTMKKRLAAIVTKPTLIKFRAAAKAFRAVAELEDYVGPNAVRSAVRCDLYAAAIGCQPSALRVAAEAALLAQDILTPDDVSAEYATTAFGWLVVASGQLVLPEKYESLGAVGRGEAREDARFFGMRVVTRMLATRHRMSEEDRLAAQSALSAPNSPDSESDQTSDVRSSGSGIVVVQRIGTTETSEGRRVQHQFGTLVGKRLPVCPVPDLAVARHELANVFPHAEPVIQQILHDSAGQPHVRVRPTILIGSPGCGKTTFAVRLMQALGVPCTVYPCGGASDASLAGTPRRWSTGSPSLPISLIKLYEVASPGLVLDELEKVGSGHQNGNLLDALLGLLEPQSSAQWHEPYLESPVDLSHVIWIATVNSIEAVPEPLRDRCRIVRFPDPGPEHLQALASRLLTQAIADRNLDARWAVPLDPEELDALARFWHGGSVRILSRLVNRIIDARDWSHAIH